MGRLLGRGSLLLGALPAGEAVTVRRTVQCVWFKRDLRIGDHAALAEAAKRGPVLPVYVIEPSIIHAADFDALHWQFIYESLLELRQNLESIGLSLVVRQGEVCQVFETLLQEYEFSQLWSHEETGNALSYARDSAMAEWAKEHSIPWSEMAQNGVVRGLADRDGWSRFWEAHMQAPQENLPRIIEPVGRSGRALIPTASDLRLTGSPRKPDIQGGESHASAILKSFIADRGHKYHREMSSPNTAYDSCSRLSAYLAWGCISMRTVVQTVRAAAGEQMPKIAARAFLSRCHWHCHFMQKLESEPAIEFHAFNRSCDDLRFGVANEAGLQAWKSGKTGYPFVDACIRSLKTRGWINFRMRAMLVSFASYHLWLDWRLFKDWLARQFIDYEPGIHISQIQMQSGLTGINTLRIYNPIKQGQDHDPGGEFIRRWVPELRDVRTEDIHEPWKMPEMIQLEANCRIGEDYPLPLVDHKEAVRYARARFSELRKRDDYWETAAAVMKRHGSRKTMESRRRPQRPRKKDKQQTEMELNENETEASG